MHGDFFFQPNMIPLHKTHGAHEVCEEASKVYSNLIELSMRIKPPEQCIKLYSFYKSKVCKLCGATLDSHSNFFYHTFSVKHKTKALPFVCIQDLQFWLKLVATAKPLVIKGKNLTAPSQVHPSQNTRLNVDKPIEKQIAHQESSTSNALANSFYNIHSNISTNNRRELDEKRNHSACQTDFSISAERESQPAFISQENLKYYDQSDSCEKIDLDYLKIRKGCLSYLMKRVDISKLNRDMPWNVKFICKHCQVECHSAYHYMEHFLSTMHTIYIVCNGKIPKLEFFHFWEKTLLRNTYS